MNFSSPLPAFFEVKYNVNSGYEITFTNEDGILIVKLSGDVLESSDVQSNDVQRVEVNRDLIRKSSRNTVESDKDKELKHPETESTEKIVVENYDCTRTDTGTIVTCPAENVLQIRDTSGGISSNRSISPHNLDDHISDSESKSDDNEHKATETESYDNEHKATESESDDSEHKATESESDDNEHNTESKHDDNRHDIEAESDDIDFEEDIVSFTQNVVNQYKKLKEFFEKENLNSITKVALGYTDKDGECEYKEYNSIKEAKQGACELKNKNEMEPEFPTVVFINDFRLPNANGHNGKSAQPIGSETTSNEHRLTNANGHKGKSAQPIGSETTPNEHRLTNANENKGKSAQPIGSETTPNEHRLTNANENKGKSAQPIGSETTPNKRRLTNANENKGKSAQQIGSETTPSVSGLLRVPGCKDVPIEFFLDCGSDCNSVGFKPKSTYFKNAIFTVRTINNKVTPMMIASVSIEGHEFSRLRLFDVDGDANWNAIGMSDIKKAFTVLIPGGEVLYFPQDKFSLKKMENGSGVTIRRIEIHPTEL